MGAQPHTKFKHNVFNRSRDMEKGCARADVPRLFGSQARANFQRDEPSLGCPLIFEVLNFCLLTPSNGSIGHKNNACKIFLKTNNF